MTCPSMAPAWTASAETELAASMPALICSNSPSCAVITRVQILRATTSVNDALPVTVSWSVVISKNRPTSDAIFRAAISLIDADPAVSLPTSRLLICWLSIRIRSQTRPSQRHSATISSVTASWTRQVSPTDSPAKGGCEVAVPLM